MNAANNNVYSTAILKIRKIQVSRWMSKKQIFDKEFHCQSTQQSSPTSPHQQSSPLSLLQKSPWIQPAEA